MPGKIVQPPRRYSTPAALYAAAALVVLTVGATPSSEEPGAMFRAYKSGIDFIDRHPGIKDTRIGRKVRKGLVDLAIGNALSAGRNTPRQDIPIGREPIAVMVIDENKDSATPYQDIVDLGPYGSSSNNF